MKPKMIVNTKFGWLNNDEGLWDVAVGSPMLDP